jgi:hypothetical protein
MFDLYALYPDFPGAKAADKQRDIPYERIKTIEQAFANEMNDARLIPYIQLHEFETLLYCKLEAFDIHYGNCARQIEALAVDAGSLLETPERIDDGQQTAPSKRIASQFPDYLDAKPIAPVAIATTIDLSVIRSKCPHFNEWLTTLEKLASSC